MIYPTAYDHEVIYLYTTHEGQVVRSANLLLYKGNLIFYKLILSDIMQLFVAVCCHYS